MGRHVALLISMRGALIYPRFTDRHRMSEADALAAENYLANQVPARPPSCKPCGSTQRW
jgi:hypothetical protein